MEYVTEGGKGVIAGVPGFFERKAKALGELGASVSWHPEALGIDKTQYWFKVYHKSSFYVMTALPFGLLIYLGTSPAQSQKLLRPVYAFLGHPALYPLGSLSYTGACGDTPTRPPPHDLCLSQVSARVNH